MEWIDCELQKPPAGCHKVLMYDILSSGENPYLGFYDSSEIGGGFFVSFARATYVRVKPSHYILIPKQPERLTPEASKEDVIV